MNRVNRSQITLGLTLIGIGLVFLLTSMGIVSIGTWRFLIDFWPLALVFLGLNIILKNTRGWWLVPLFIVLVIIVLLIAGNSHYGPQPYFNRNYQGIERDYAGTYSNTAELEDNINRLKANISFGAGKLELNQVKDRKLLYQMDLKYTGAIPGVDYHYKEEIREGQLVVEKDKEFDWANITGLADNWLLAFSKQIPLNLQINAGAGQLDLNLEELKVDQLSVNSGASDLDIGLGNYNSYIYLNSGATRVDFYLPREVGVSIRINGVISKNNFIKSGLVEISEDHYRSNNFTEAANKVRIEIKASASKIELNYL